MKKIRYIPGIFSIVFLPILGIWYLNKYDYFQKLSAHNFAYFDFNSVKKWRKEDSSYDAYEYDKRIYKEVNLNGNQEDSRKTVRYIDDFVNDVIKTKDTINGLKIHFEEKATYNEFIEILNIFNEREAQMYILDHNTIYFVGRDWKPPSPDDEKLEPLSMIYCTSVIIDFESESNFHQIWGNLKTQFNQNKIIYSGYLVLVIVTILSIYIKKKKLQKFPPLKS
nr:hypothetical protein [uncultured Flavobacterium sp.]